MATPREITIQEYKRIHNKLLKKACKLSRLARRGEDIAYWFSSAFKPCSGKVHTTDWKCPTPCHAEHFTSTPCDEYCSEKMPMATCLFVTYDDRCYICHHKVGNCPWKM